MSIKTKAPSTDRSAAYATISAACFNGQIAAGHRDWLDAQTDEFVIAMADKLHPPNAEVSSRRETPTSKGKHDE